MANLRTKGERIGGIVVSIVLFALTACFLLPFVIVISTSLVSEAEVARRGAFILIPQNPTIDSYSMILHSSSTILNAYKNTLFRVVVGTGLNLLFSSTLAYGLSKHDLPGRTGIITYIFITMVFAGGMVPNFMLMNAIGLYDSVWVMIFPSLINTWNMIILKNFFIAVPAGLEESAELDGASPLRTLFSIILPVSLPALATIGLYYAVWHWNSWFDASIYINDRSLYPIQIILRNIILTGSNQDVSNQMMLDSASIPPAESLKCATIVISTLPILLVYPFLQKYFVKGVMVGSMKG